MGLIESGHQSPTGLLALNARKALDRCQRRNSVSLAINAFWLNLIEVREQDIVQRQKVDVVHLPGQAFQIVAELLVDLVQR